MQWEAVRGVLPACACAPVCMCVVGEVKWPQGHACMGANSAQGAEGSSPPPLCALPALTLPPPTHLEHPTPPRLEHTSHQPNPPHLEHDVHSRRVRNVLEEDVARVDIIHELFGVQRLHRGARRGVPRRTGFILSLLLLNQEGGGEGDVQGQAARHAGVGAEG